MSLKGANMKRTLIMSAAFAIAAAVMPPSADASAQGLMDRLKRRAEDSAKREAEERAERKAEEAAREATSEALDRAECAVAGSNCDAPPLLGLTEAVNTKGRAVAAGVVFEPGTDRLRPEANGTLAEVAGLLQQNPDLKLTIEAHAYTAGNADANLALSDKRAAAVKAYLARTHKVSPARLVTQGLGDTTPAAGDNDASRRIDRIELVKN